MPTDLPFVHVRINHTEPKTANDRVWVNYGLRRPPSVSSAFGGKAFSQDAVAALEKRLLARIDELLRDVSGGFRLLIWFLIIVVLVGAAIEFIWGLF